ncbi:hypothetical protein ACFFX0_20420 [Citricoccus parietis]|uniref:SRCR domain-containing protein n=1 Tax=Citricoccus parietis TaxID=592307 RepID=A0ABV5G3C8_9MICC
MRSLACGPSSVRCGRAKQLVCEPSHSVLVESTGWSTGRTIEIWANVREIRTWACTNGAPER